MIEVGEERARSFLSAVGLIGRREAEGHHAFGPESGIELLQAQQTLDEQRGARDHRQRDRDAESYYAALAHETTHWTAHESRGARDFGTTRFGSEGYAIEELVAELGATFLCADLDLTLEPRDDHAAYIAHWLDVLTADNRAIFAAASHAQRAADFINGLQPASAG